MVEPDVLDRLEHLLVQRVERGQLAAQLVRVARLGGTRAHLLSTLEHRGLHRLVLELAVEHEEKARLRHDRVRGGVRLVVRLAIVQVTAVA
jgi:hypothetical protein